MIAENITYTLEECKEKLIPSLYKKLEYSVNLIRKAEKLALAYDSEDGYHLAFSGGKDSQVLYHVAKIAGVKFKAHMNLTSIDPAPVIRFVKKEYPSTNLIKPKKSIFALAAEKKLLPTMFVRWCCAEYKESAGAGKVTLIGIRHEESQRRAKRNEVEINSRKFSGTLEELDEYREQKANAKYARKANKVTIVNASGERTLGCISGKESLLISPIIQWTEKEVWEFLNTLNIPHCSVYDEGKTRVGCLCCPMAQYKQKLQDIASYPHIKRNWIETIKAIRRGGAYRGTTGSTTAKNSASKDALTVDISSTTNGCSITPTGTPHSAQGTSGGTSRELKFFDQEKYWTLGGFSDGSSPDGLTEEQIEDLIAERIFAWWISGKPYDKWYAETFLQQKIEFEFD